tara:strand:+ start:491 stop:958 length:468 start_codon:yes stop_codon:yes gene_type:complete
MEVLVTFNSDVENFKAGQKVAAQKVETTYSTRDEETFETHSWTDVKYLIGGMCFGHEYFSKVEEMTSSFVSKKTEIDTVLSECEAEVKEVEEFILQSENILDLVSEKSKLKGRKKLIAIYLILKDSKRGQAAKRVLIKRNKRIKLKNYAKQLGLC